MKKKAVSPTCKDCPIKDCGVPNEVREYCRIIGDSIGSRDDMIIMPDKKKVNIVRHKR